MLKNQRKIISVGGSIIIPHEGFDVAFLKKFKSLILKQVAKGQQFILIIGGGGTARQYQKTAKEVEKKLTNEDLDWIGINATIMNAKFVRFLFKELAYKEVVIDPRKKINTTQPIIVAAGWKPGCSTDNDAVILAKTFGVSELINLSNIEYVFDKDPNKYKDAKKIESIHWPEFRRDIVGYDWVAGKNAPFDPIASGGAEKQKMTVSILNGKDLTQVRNVLDGKKFKGTLIKP